MVEIPPFHFSLTCIVCVFAATEKRCSILPGGGRAKPLDDTPYKVHIEKLHMAQCGLKPHPEIIVSLMKHSLTKTIRKLAVK